MHMRKIYLIRHAESEANVGGVFMNSNNITITEKGKKQAEDLKEILEKPNRIIVSKYIRTVETAEPTIKKYNDAEVHLWLDTHEFTYMDPSNLEELKLSHLMERAIWYWGQNDPEYRDGPNRETFEEFADRMHQLILKLSKLDGVNYIFTHGYVIRLFKILTANYTYKSFEDSKASNQDHYKQIMNVFNSMYNTKEGDVENTAVLDMTSLVEAYTQNMV